MRLPVSSLRLWERLPQVDRPRARLRRPPLSLLLILQALLLLAGAFALLQPAAETAEGRHYLILLDASGSMGAAQDGSTRFEQARAEARRVVGEMRDLDRATLLRVGPNVTTACSLCTKGDTERALMGVRVGAGRADMGDALSLASGLAGQQGGGRVETVIISDGGFQIVDEAALPPNSRFISVGKAADNTGVTRLAARRALDGRPGYSAYARVDNGGGSEVTLEITAFADTVPLPARSVTLATGEHADLTWQVAAGAERFTVSAGSRDSLSSDDTAVIFLPKEGQHRVGIVSDNPDLYRRVVAGIPGLQPVVTKTTDSSLAFTIIEGALPPTLPNGSLLLVNPQGALFPSDGNVADVRPVAAGEAHPVLRGVDLAALLVRQAPQLEAPAWLQPVVVSNAGAPLLLLGERDGQRVAVLAFDPDQSNLPKLAAFPLLFANLVDWLYPLAGAGALMPGESLYLPPGSLVRAPGSRALQVGGNGVFSEADEAGVYEVVPPGAGEQGPQQQPLRFAVNMADPAESSLAVSPHPELTRQSAGADERITKQEYWPPLAAFALALLGLEWLIYCWRRGRP